jgi:hypothetical protein
LCAIFEVDKNLKNEDSPAQDSKSFLEFIYRLDMDGGVVDSPLVFTFPKDKFYRPGSFGLWLFISHVRFRGHLDVRDCISPSITTNTPHVEIKLCGARLVYEEDMVEFVKHFSQEAFGSPDVLHQCHQEFIEYHKNSSESPDAQISDSNPRLKTELNTLLSILYQVISPGLYRISSLKTIISLSIFISLTHEHHIYVCVCVCVCVCVFYRKTLHETTGTIISFLKFRFPDGSIINKILCPT